jgi:Ca2+-binding EF-hand superfamily protein
MNRFHSLENTYKYMSEASRIDGSEVSPDLSMREFSTVMYRTRMCTLQEARILFDAIDLNTDGIVTVEDFIRVIATSAPIVTLEGFRAWDKILSQIFV